MAEAIAELRAAALRSARDEAQRLITDLGAPGHKLGAAVAGLKRYAARMQEAFAAAMLPLLEASSTQDTPARARLDALIAFDMQLRGITEDDAAESETSPLSVEAPHAG